MSDTTGLLEPEEEYRIISPAEAVAMNTACWIKNSDDLLEECRVTIARAQSVSESIRALSAATKVLLYERQYVDYLLERALAQLGRSTNK